MIPTCWSLLIDTHQAWLGRAPYWAAADAAFYSAKNECRKGKGRQTSNVGARKKLWFRNGQKWRIACGGTHQRSQNGDMASAICWGIARNGNKGGRARLAPKLS